MIHKRHYLVDSQLLLSTCMYMYTVCIEHTCRHEVIYEASLHWLTWEQLLSFVSTITHTTCLKGISWYLTQFKGRARAKLELYTHKRWLSRSLVYWVKKILSNGIHVACGCGEGGWKEEVVAIKLLCVPNENFTFFVVARYYACRSNGSEVICYCALSIMYISIYLDKSPPQHIGSIDLAWMGRVWN